MRDDFYIFDERGKTFRGQRSKKVFHLGDTIHVRVIRVDEIEGQIDMELIEEAEFLADEGSDGVHRHTHRSGRSERSAPATAKKGRKERTTTPTREARAGSSRKKKSEPVAEVPRKGRKKRG
jgi:ribonuclease R